MSAPNPSPLILQLQPAQGKAFMSRATEILYGGAAGAGKSHLIRVAFIAWAQMIPGLQLGLFRRTYPDLQKNHMDGPTSFPVLLAPLVERKGCRIVKNEIEFANGSRITLNHCQHEQDRFRYQGAEFHVLAFDELTHFTETTYRFLRSRVRMTGLELPAHLRGLFPRIISGANPGGIGHVWVKRTFVTAAPPFEIHRTTAEEGSMLRQYIPARLSDNPALSATDPEYEARLTGLGDPVLVRAMLDGDWSIVAGSMFGDAWREHLHTVDDFPIPDHWDLWRGADDGFSAPASVHWITQDPHRKTFYVVDELYRPKMRPDEFDRRIKQHDRSIPMITGDGESTTNERTLEGILDSAAFGDVGLQESIPRGHQLNKLGCKFRPAEKWPGSRMARVKYMHQLMGPNPHDPRGMPAIRFFRRACPVAIETIPALPRDKNNPEDVDTDAEDHAFDSVCYGLQYKKIRFGSRKVSGT